MNREVDRAASWEVSRRVGFRPLPLPSPIARIAAAGLGGWSDRPGMTDTDTMDADMMELF
jgi:hypothetical protein